MSHMFVWIQLFTNRHMYILELRQCDAGTENTDIETPVVWYRYTVI